MGTGIASMLIPVFEEASVRNSMRTTMHDLRNHLSVAIANVEAVVDGKLDATPKRLESVLNSLKLIAAMIETLPLQARDNEGEVK
jgi:hypothetical protein